MLGRLLLTVVLIGTSVAPAQGADVEIFGGLAFWFPRLDTQYDASYTPSRVVGIRQMFTDPDPRSTTRQLLTLQGVAGPGFGVGISLFPHPVVGFQVLFDRTRLDVVGENPSHEMSLTYDTIDFPNPDRIVATTSHSFDQADTMGTLEETTLSLNLAARFGTGGVVSGNVSGGLSYFRFDLAAEPLGAHAAWLGGHAILFSELYEMSYASETADTFGFNLGGQVDLNLGHVALFADARLLRTSTAEAAVHLDQRLSTNVITIPLTQVEEFLDLPPLEIDPTTIRLLFGLKWKP